MESERSAEEIAFLRENLGKLNRAYLLLHQETPTPDMPLQVGTLLHEVISEWVTALSDDWYANEVMSLDAPELDTLMQWLDEGVCESTDGCLVQADGYCEHGEPSWLVELGLI